MWICSVASGRWTCGVWGEGGYKADRVGGCAAEGLRVGRDVGGGREGLLVGGGRRRSRRSTFGVEFVCFARAIGVCGGGESQVRTRAVFGRGGLCVGGGGRRGGRWRALFAGALFNALCECLLDSFFPSVPI